MGESIPPEVVEQLRKFNEALTDLEDTYQEYFANSLDENTPRPPLEKLHVDLMSVFVINSLYWMLLCTHGRKPKDSELLQNEIKRTKEYMGRLKQVEDRKLAPRLNERAAKSFVRNALWEPKEQGQVMEEESGTSSQRDEDECKGRFEMASGDEDDESTSMEEDEIEVEPMEESPSHVPMAKAAPKRSPQETSATIPGCTVPKKKRI